MKEILRNRGLSGDNGSQIYLAMKLGINLENLLRTNNWEEMFRNSEYTRLSH